MHQINQRENSSSFLSYSLSSATSSTQLIHQNNNASYHTNSYDHQSQLIDQLPPMSTFASSQFVSNQPLLTSSHNFNELVIQNPNSEETLENAPFEMDTQSLDMVDMLTSPYDFDANTYLPDTPAIISNGLSESHDHYFGNALTSHEQPNHINHHELSFSNSLQNHLNLPIGQTQSVGEILASMDFSETETFLTDHYCSTDQNVSSNQNHNHNHNHNSVQQNSTIEQISQQQLPIQLPFTTNALTVNDPHLISHVVQITTVQASQPQPNCQFNHKNQLVIENTQTHIPNGLSLTSESRDKDEEYHFSGIVSNSSDIFANDITDLIEEVKCYKCKLCDFIHLKKEFISVHVHEKHKVDSNEKIDKNNKHKTVDSSKKPNSYLCCKCYQGFSTLESCRQHMVDLHNFKVDQVTLVSTSRNVNHDINSNESSESSNDKSKQMSKKLRHILPVTVKPFTMKKKQNNSKKINKKAINNNKNNNIESVNMNNLDNNDNESSIVNNNSNNNNSNNNTPNNNTPNNKVSKKIAWRKKMKRELGAYICEFKGCSVRFRSLENLQYHHKCHKDTGSGFACCNCGTKSENWASMAGHLWRSHNIDLELYACGHCNYRTYSLSMLENIHKRIHGDEKNFLCDICGKGFKNSKQLVNHKVKHKVDITKSDIVKAHECSVCQRQFNDARSVRVHQQTVHNKTRPYICSHCNHSAASRSALRIHMRQHTGEKPFECDLCEYTTSDHNSLRRHKMRHSGERPYKCPFCSYACIQSSTYKQHLKNKHPGQNDGLMFTCQFCGFKTVNQELYHTHRAEHNVNNINVQENQQDHDSIEDGIHISSALIYTKS